MFERFTDQARKIVILAKAKAAERGDGQIRPVRMLYGAAVTDGVAARALTALGVDAADVERELGRTGAGAGVSPGPLGPPDEAATGDAEALAAIGIDLDEIKRRIEDSFGPGALQRVPLAPRGPLNWTGRLPLSEQAKLSLALSLKEARALQHRVVNPGVHHLPGRSGCGPGDPVPTGRCPAPHQHHIRSRRTRISGTPGPVEGIVPAPAGRGPACSRPRPGVLLP